MLTIKKNQKVQTKFPGIYYIVRATPEDSLDADGLQKAYYIVDVVDQNQKDGRVYSIEMKVFDAAELREAFGLKRNEKLQITRA